MRTTIVAAACVAVVLVSSSCSLIDQYRAFKALNDWAQCKPESGPRLPSNYEMVRAADAIVLATVSQVGKVRLGERGGSALLDYRAEFEVQRVLKGFMEENTLTFFGFEDRSKPAREDNFSKPIRLGADPITPPYPCGVPYHYRAGSEYLLFLVRHREDGQWTFPDIPRGRLNEEVTGEEAPWVQAVTHYIRIASLQNEQAEAQALRELQATAKRGDDEKHYPPALVQDVEWHFEKQQEGSNND